MKKKMATSNNNDWVEIEPLTLENLDDLPSYKFALVRAYRNSLNKKQVQLDNEPYIIPNTSLFKLFLIKTNTI